MNAFLFYRVDLNPLSTQAKIGVFDPSPILKIRSYIFNAIMVLVGLAALHLSAIPMDHHHGLIYQQVPQ